MAMLGNNITSLPNFMLYCLLLIVVVSVGIDVKDVFAQNRFEEYDVWEDPDKQFRLQYPTNWIVQPTENSSEQYDIMFAINGTESSLGVDLTDVPPSRDLKGIMEASVESTTNSPDNTRLKMKLFEGPEYLKRGKG